MEFVCIVENDKMSRLAVGRARSTLPLFSSMTNTIGYGNIHQ